MDNEGAVEEQVGVHMTSEGRESETYEGSPGGGTGSSCWWVGRGEVGGHLKLVLRVGDGVWGPVLGVGVEHG